MKETILTGVEAMFLRYGIRSVSMDDIAHQLGISKKTIYQYFDDKNDLVKQITSNIINTRFRTYDDYSKVASNAIEELYLISKQVRDHFSELNAAMMFDLQKYYPDAWRILHGYEQEVIYHSVIDNLKRGVKERNYRSDINPEILAKMRIELIHLMLDDSKFPKDKFQFKEVQIQVFDHFVHGILTEAGLKLYKEYQKENDE